MIHFGRRGQRLSYPRRQFVAQPERESEARGVTRLSLRASPRFTCALRPLGEIRLRTLFGRVADLEVIHHRNRSRRLCHPGRGAFVLNDIRTAFHGGRAALHAKLELVRANFRFCQFRLNRSFDLCIRQTAAQSARQALSADGPQEAEPGAAVPPLPPTA